MKLLILTQKVDRDDPILGFFHKWIEEFSKRFESVVVVCLEKGKFDLPSNVKIFSLGKESGRNKIKYLKNFYNLILGLHKEYDSVFVHMNQEYLILGGFLWKVMRKKISFWRNHPNGNLLTRIAVLFSNKVFCTSPGSFTARFDKTVIMPVGVDTDRFKVQSEKLKVEEKRNKILFLSRISLIKKPDLLIDALNILNEKNIDFVCNFYGDPALEDERYYSSLKLKVKELGLENKINFHKGVPNYETPKIYNEHAIFINLTPSGSFDKTILESASCGCIPVVINDYFKNIFDPKMLTDTDAHDVADKINYWLSVDAKKIEQMSKKLQEYVLENHSLNALVQKLETFF